MGFPGHKKQAFIVDSLENKPTPEPGLWCWRNWLEENLIHHSRLKKRVTLEQVQNVHMTKILMKFLFLQNPTWN